MPHPLGSHLKVSGGAYSHHGVYIGDHRVVHYTGEVGRKRHARVQVDALSTFARGGTVQVVRYARRLSGRAAVERALSRVGESSYDLVFNNCEHFARWCCTGDHASEQVRTAASTTAGAVGSAATTAAALGTVSAAGAVAGLSGPGILSGLAAVGAGAVGGLATLATAPATIGAMAMHSVLRDDEKLPSEERAARKAGRIASMAGGAVGTAGAIGAVSASGAAAGLSGAGIASGLAAIGGTVGGGMAAGTALCVLAPAAAAVAVGYGIYRLWKAFSR